jgi:hypothetical protein
MKYTIYDPSTGKITSNLTITDDSQLTVNLTEKHYLTDHYASNLFYIENGQAVAKPDDPTTATKKYVFNYATKQYEIDLLFSGIYSRQQRDQLLGQIDRVNPVWYASLTTEQQQELIAYRQALLDVPQQMGFPTAVSWPAKPHWL